jgi:single-stranded-DNA-specific exonuclease
VYQAGACYNKMICWVFCLRGPIGSQPAAASRCNSENDQPSHGLEQKADMRHFDWKIGRYDRAQAAQLTRGGLNPLTAVILSARNIAQPAEIRNLTEDTLDPLCPPFLMKDMDRAAARIARAIETGEHVAVYGDYDVDGITSACLMAAYLRSKKLPCTIYIPDRLQEGYGVRKSGIDRLRAQGVTLIVTVDCGVTAVEEAVYASQQGIDMVITDHHECGGTALPAAVAVVDPKRPDCPYPFKQLAGVGVAFKLICAVERQTPVEALLAQYSDLVALGTVADVMPVTGENRVFLRRGLAAMRRGSRVGIAALCAAAGTELGQLNVGSAGFSIAPRLNAAGRVGTTDTAVRLLLTEDPAQAEECAQTLCAYNRQRQQLEGAMFEDAVAMLEKNPPAGGPIVLASSAWHQGVAGIVASRLAEKYGLPCVMICLKDGLGRGSCRSVPGMSIYNALEACAAYLDSFGGHDMAAGLNIQEQNIPAFRQALAQAVQQQGSCTGQQTLEIDFEVIKPGLLTVQNVEAARVLEPYGIGNPAPLLCIRGAEIMSVTPLSGGKHTKFRIRKYTEQFDCVFFSKSPEELGVAAGRLVEVAFTPQVNAFRDRKSVQLLLSDVRVS